MELGILAEVVTTFGLPAACLIWGFWFINKQEENHREDVKNLTEAVNNNTIVMQKVCDKLEDMKK